MNPTAARATAWRDIYEQQAMDAAFLWHRRATAVHQPDYRPADIASLERRLDCHLDALMHRSDLAWEACSEALSGAQAGEAFAAATVALRRNDPDHIARALDAGFTNDNTFRGLVSAVSWLPDRLAHDWMQRFLRSQNLDQVHLAIAVHGLRTQDLGAALTRLLQRDDCRAHAKLLARCLRVAGMFKRTDLADVVEAATDNGDSGVRFWALWSSVLLGRRERARELRPYVQTDNPWRPRAIQLAFRALPIATAVEWIEQPAANITEARCILKAMAALGDPDPVPRLIEAMQKPLLARLAGEAFATLTGRDLARDGLALECAPVSFDVLDAQDPDVIFEDEKLPWPDPDAVAQAWRRSAAAYRPGERYFLGRCITPEHLRGVIDRGHQRQRHAAALELALHELALPLPNTCARQMVA